MLKPRVIPVLLLKDEGLVKSKQFSSYKYIGDPINAVKIFNLKEVDELIFLDIEATCKNHEPDYCLIKDIATEAFMPFSYGGGIRNIEQIRKLLRIGVEKVIINNSLFNEKFVKQAVETFGSSTIIASIDVKYINSKPYVYNHLKNVIYEDVNLFEFIKHITNLGVGELMINSVDRDGTFVGYDLELFSQISDQVKIPVVGCGGAKDITDIKLLFSRTSCSAAAGGSMFVYYGKHNAVLITYPDLNDF